MEFLDVFDLLSMTSHAMTHLSITPMETGEDPETTDGFAWLDSLASPAGHDPQATADDPTEIGAHPGSETVGAILVGNPAADEQYWRPQESDYSCAISSQGEVLEALTGERIPEEELARLADECGWYDPACGTPPEAVGSILEAYGIPVDRAYDLGITDLFDALARGEKVIVGLDANEIWSPRLDEHGTPIEQPDAGHAVWVTGMEMGDDGKVSVILNDTGKPDGAGCRVDVEDFLNAWDDFGNLAVTTRLHAESALG